MDQDERISEVYNKGETLLQNMSGSAKSRLESQLADYEKEWAEFCQDVSSVVTKQSQLSEGGELETRLGLKQELERDVRDLEEWLSTCMVLSHEKAAGVLGLESIVTEYEVTVLTIIVYTCRIRRL